MLDQRTIDRIVVMAAGSDLARINWSGRGRAPAGYIKGMAVTYGLCLQKLAARDSAALAMVRVVEGEHDVFDHYEAKLRAIDIVTAGASDVDRLRALFVVLTGLGMRESSGRYCEGRDRSASNTSAETAEAGLFQMSWGARRASPEIAKLLDAPRTGRWAWEIFREGVTSTGDDMEVYGSGDGAKFQEVCKLFPDFAVQTAAIGLRTLYNEWGPIIRQEAEVRPEADALFRQVQTIIGVQSGTAGKPAAPSTGWLSMLAAAVMAMFRSAPTKPAPVPAPAATDLAGRIVAAMRKRGFKVDDVPGNPNIVYVEGMGPEGTKNDNPPNQFNDARFVIMFGQDGRPKIAGAWEATTEPGNYWTEHRMNPGGAFHIALEQQTAWVVGVHHAGSPSAHEALVQHGAIRGFRDPDETGKRDTRHPYSGDDMGINQHWGYDLAKGDLGTSSAGCLVGRMKTGHRQFMTLVKSDPRYIANNRFVFTAAVLPASEI